MRTALCVCEAFHLGLKRTAEHKMGYIPSADIVSTTLMFIQKHSTFGNSTSVDHQRRVKNIRKNDNGIVEAALLVVTQKFAASEKFFLLFTQFCVPMQWSAYIYL